MIDPTSVHWQRVDTFLEHRLARWGFSVACGTIVGLWATVREWAPLAVIASGAALFALLVVADLWIWRRLRRNFLQAPNDPYLNVVYAHGVFSWGVTMWLIMAPFFAYRSATEAHPRFSPPWFEAAAFHTVLSLAMNLVIFLLGGYAWGRFMAATFRVQRSSTRA